MTASRRRTRSIPDSATSNGNGAEENETAHKDTDVLFGSYDFLESHPGTKQWASIVGSYSQQCYWSSTLYQKILNDKRLAGKRYFVMLKKNKYRLATELEIEQRTCGIFDNGGGKKKQSRKRKSSNGDVNATGTIIDGSERRQLQEGDSVYVYDQLWRAKIVEVGDFLDGVKFKVHFMGFLATSDQWVDRVQIFPHSEKMKEIYHQIDKAEGTAFQGEYDLVETNGDEDDEEDEDITGAKKRRRAKTTARRGAGSSQNNSPSAPTRTRTSANPRRSRSSSNTSTTAESEASDESNVISASDYNDVTKLASDGNSEILSHRLFSLKPKSKSTLNNRTAATIARGATPEVTTATATASITSNPTLDLSQIVADALEKCETVKQNAQESGMTEVVPLLNAEAANWSLAAINQFLNVGEIRTNLPSLDEMQSDVDKWKQEGGIKRLEAMAMERNIKKWKKAQEHLARFVDCLVEDLVSETTAFLPAGPTYERAMDMSQVATRIQSTAGNYLDNLGGGASSLGSSYGSVKTNGAFSFVPTLSLEQADLIANNVVGVCQRNGFNPVAVTVLDSAGSTIVSKRMDGCPVVGIPEFSRAKAYSCVVNKYPSRVFRDRYTAEEASAKFCQMTSMVAISGNQMAPFPGGIMLKVNDYVIGAVGVSGAAGDEDEYCAITAVQEANIPGLAPVPSEHSCSTVNEPIQR